MVCYRNLTKNADFFDFSGRIEVTCSTDYSNVEEITRTSFAKKILQSADFELPLVFEQGI